MGRLSAIMVQLELKPTGSTSASEASMVADVNQSSDNKMLNICENKESCERKTILFDKFG